MVFPGKAQPLLSHPRRKPPVGEHERYEEPGEWRRRTLPSQLGLGHDERHGHQPEYHERGDAVDERVRRRDWLAAAAVSAGIGVFLRVASPSGGRLHAPGSSWLLAGLVTAGVVFAALAVAFGLGRRPVAPGPAGPSLWPRW